METVLSNQRAWAILDICARYDTDLHTCTFLKNHRTIYQLVFFFSYINTVFCVVKFTSNAACKTFIAAVIWYICDSLISNSQAFNIYTLIPGQQNKIRVIALHMARVKWSPKLSVQVNKLSKLIILLICICLGALDHIVVTIQDGKFPLNQLGQISVKSSQFIMVNMSSFPEVRLSHAHIH